MRRLVAPLLLLPFLLPLLASAQIPGGADPLTLQLSPQYPRPYDVVTITPSSNAIDLANASTVFYVNGTKIASGSGAESENIQMGAAGVASTVRVVATYQGQPYEDTITIRPADVALVTEAVSTSHPFYQGANLVAAQGTVRLTAIPDLRTSANNRIPASGLTYTWKLGDQLLESQSGIGKSTVTAVAPVRYRDATISVTVTSADGSIAGYASVDLTPADTLMRLYELDPLMGPRYDNALTDSYTLNGSEDTFVAVPYFFATTPVFAWTLNGNAAGSASSLTMRQSGSGAGTADVGVSALLNSFSSASASTQVTFGQSGSGGFFGL